MCAFLLTLARSGRSPTMCSDKKGKWRCQMYVMRMNEKCWENALVRINAPHVGSVVLLRNVEYAAPRRTLWLTVWHKRPSTPQVSSNTVNLWNKHRYKQQLYHWRNYITVHCIFEPNGFTVSWFHNNHISFVLFMFMFTLALSTIFTRLLDQQHPITCIREVKSSTGKDCSHKSFGVKEEYRLSDWLTGG